MVGAIVETVLGAFVLRKGRDASKSLGTLVIDVFTKRTAGDAHLSRHLSGIRSKVIIAPPKQPLVKLEDVAIKFEQIDDCVVVLKPIHPSDRHRAERLRLQRLCQHALERRHHLLALDCRKYWFVFRRHLAILQYRNQPFEQFRLNFEFLAGLQCQQVDLALNLAPRTVTPDAMRLERRL